MPMFRAVVRTIDRGATDAARRRFETRVLGGLWRATDRLAREGTDLAREDIRGAGLGRLAVPTGYAGKPCLLRPGVRRTCL